MEKIAMKENDSTCSCSYSLRKFAEMFFTEIRLLDKIERENELLFDNIKWNLTKNLEINLGKRDFYVRSIRLSTILYFRLRETIYKDYTRNYQEQSQYHRPR